MHRLIFVALFILFSGCGLKIGDSSSAAKTIDFDGGTDEVTSAASDSRGNLALGGSTSKNGSGTNFAVAYLSKGTELSKFEIDFSTSDDRATGVAFFADGSLAVVGRTANTSDQIVAARINSAGALDTSFGDAGKKTRIGSYGDRAVGVRVDALDNMVIAGDSTAGGRSTFVVLRLKRDGTPDTSFNGSGRVEVDLLGAQATATAMEIGPDGSIYVAGYGAQGTVTSAAIVKVMSSGQVDPGFGSQGRTLFRHPSSSFDQIRAIGVDSYGIVGVGNSSLSGTSRAAVFSITPQGQVDYNFFGYGVVGLASTDPGIALGQGLIMGSPLTIGSTFHGEGKSKGWVSYVDRSGTAGTEPVRAASYLAESNQAINIVGMVQSGAGKTAFGTISSGSLDFYLSGSVQ